MNKEFIISLGAGYPQTPFIDGLVKKDIKLGSVESRGE